MAQFARPEADININGNIGQSGAATNWEATDEVSPDDSSTYVQFNNSNVGDYFDVRLSDLTDPVSSSDHILRVRVGNVADGNVTLRGQLYQGNPDSGGTLILSTSTAQPGALSFTTITHNLSGTEADNITDYTDLHVRVEVTARTGGAEESACTWIELEVPDASTTPEAGLPSVDVEPLGALAAVEAGLPSLDWEVFGPLAAPTSGLVTVDYSPLAPLAAATAGVVSVDVTPLAIQSIANAGLVTVDVSTLAPIAAPTAGLVSVDWQPLAALAAPTAGIATVDVEPLGALAAVDAGLASIDVQPLAPLASVEAGLVSVDVEPLAPISAPTAGLVTVDWNPLGITASELDLVVTFSKTSGVAPLAVAISYDGTTSPETTRPFHEIDFYTDFGDPGSGNWAISGHSKEWESGPLVYHTFETPGTYEIVSYAFDGVTIKTFSQTITVDDPDTVYSGLNTICISNDTDHTGAPDGADLVDNISNLSDIDSRIAADTRILLKRGDSFSGTTSLTIDVDSFYLGDYGSGAKPVLSYTGSTDFIVIDSANGTDCLIKDLDIRGNNSGLKGITFSGTAQTSDAMVFRVDATEFADDVFFLSTSSGGGSRRDNLRSSLVECSNTRGTTTDVFSYRICGTWSVLAGCTGDGPTGAGTSSWVRSGAQLRSIFCYNDVPSSMDSSSAMKIHARPFSVASDISQYLAFYGNQRDATNTVSEWIAVGPEDNSTDQRTEDVIIERNFLSNGQESHGIRLFGIQRATVRSNVFYNDQKNQFVPTSTATRGIEPDPDEIYFVGNTIVDEITTSDEPRSFQIGSTATNCWFEGNLLWCASTSAPRFPDDSGTGTTSQNNVNANNETETDVFEIALPAEPEPADFVLDSDSTFATNNMLDLSMSSTYLLRVFRDYHGDKLDGDPDIGAIQLNDEGAGPEGGVCGILTLDVQPLALSDNPTAGIATVELTPLALESTPTAGLVTLEVTPLGMVAAPTAGFPRVDIEPLVAESAPTAGLATVDYTPLGLTTVSEVGIATVELSALAPIAAPEAGLVSVDITPLAAIPQGVFVSGVVDVWNIPGGGNLWNIPDGGNIWNVP